MLSWLRPTPGRCFLDYAHLHVMLSWLCLSPRRCFADDVSLGDTFLTMQISSVMLSWLRQFPGPCFTAYALLLAVLILMSRSPSPCFSGFSPHRRGRCLTWHNASHSRYFANRMSLPRFDACLWSPSPRLMITLEYRFPHSMLTLVRPSSPFSVLTDFTPKAMYMSLPAYM
jgi:hypothetical protein